MNDAPFPIDIVAGETDGEDPAVDELFEVLYGTLRAMASTQRSRWTGDYTLNTTALVHEAYVKLAGRPDATWRDRAHFLAVAARAMRHVLVNYARRRQAQKRGGGAAPVTLETIAGGRGVNPVAEEVAPEVLALDRALDRLAERNERHARVVECRFFARMKVRETAEALGISESTVKRDWEFASAWLRREVRREIGDFAAI